MTTFVIPRRFTPSPQLMRTLAAVAVVGGGITGLGLFTEPQRTWPNLLLASYYAVSLGLGAVLFIALQYVSNAGWSVALRRVPEAIASVLPVFGALLLVTFFLGIPRLYEWSQPSLVVADPVLRSKASWLSVPFFIARSCVYLGLWWFLSYKMIRLSKYQDTNGEADITGWNKGYSAAFIVVFAVTISLASFDWIMSLEPRWYSTIFGVYNFSGLFLTALAAVTMLVILLRRSGALEGIVTSDHLHNLGKLIFAFSTFWMYIWFSQYLLIWYANIPEEAIYFVRRQQGSWTVFSVVNVIFNWVIPFIVLLPQWTKKNETILLRVCIIILIGRWVDLFWMILPPFAIGNAHFGLWEIAPITGILSLFFLLTARFLSRGNIVPLKDPMLVESIQYHEGRIVS